jgi:hypothetical protein
MVGLARLVYHPSGNRRIANWPADRVDIDLRGFVAKFEDAAQLAACNRYVDLLRHLKFNQTRRTRFNQTRRTRNAIFLHHAERRGTG